MQVYINNIHHIKDKVWRTSRIHGGKFAFSDQSGKQKKVTDVNLIYFASATDKKLCISTFSLIDAKLCLQSCLFFIGESCRFDTTISPKAKNNNMCTKTASRRVEIDVWRNLSKKISSLRHVYENGKSLSEWKTMSLIHIPRVNKTWHHMIDLPVLPSSNWLEIEISRLGM